MTRVLVINSGSSSLKLQIIDTGAAAGAELAWALVERIGEPVGTLTVRRSALTGSPAEERTVQAGFADHSAALARVLELAGELRVHPTDLGVEAIGHRVVHGEQNFVADGLDHASAMVDDQTRRLAFESLDPLDQFPLGERLALRGVADDVDEADRHDSHVVAHRLEVGQQTARRTGQMATPHVRLQ